MDLPVSSFRDSPPAMLFQMTFGEQNTEKEAHEMLSYSFDYGINIIDTAEAVSPLLNFVTFTLMDILD